MTLTKGIPGLAAIAVITVILLIPQGMTQTLASHTAPTPFAGDPLHHFPNLAVEDDPNYVEDTIGDVKIKAIFHFNKEGMEIIDSFRIMNQLEGFTKGSGNVVQLLGGVMPWGIRRIVVITTIAAIPGIPFVGVMFENTILSSYLKHDYDFQSWKFMFLKFWWWGIDGNVNSWHAKVHYELGYYPAFPSMVTRTDVPIRIHTKTF